MSKNTNRDFYKLVAALGLCYAASAIGGLVTSTSVTTWYLELARPSWNPPGWIFGPVWLLLFSMMGIALWLVWKSPGRHPRAMLLFAIQLVLNVCWSALFFGLQSPGLAFVEIFVLLIAIVFTMLSFFKTVKKAGLLMVPYLLWTLFAAYLNGTIWWMNR